MPEGEEDGYSLEGFEASIPGITLEVRESQISSVPSKLAGTPDTPGQKKVF